MQFNAKQVQIEKQEGIRKLKEFEKLKEQVDKEKEQKVKMELAKAKKQQEFQRIQMQESNQRQQAIKMEQLIGAQKKKDAWAQEDQRFEQYCASVTNQWWAPKTIQVYRPKKAVDQSNPSTYTASTHERLGFGV